MGNVLTMTSGGKTTTYTYDRFGNVLTEKDAFNKTKTYHYNGIGRLESVTDKNGVETEYFYDALGRILKTEATDSSGTEVQLFTYSKTGQVLSKANEDTTTSYTYDDLGRVETITELYEGYSDIPEYEDPAPEPNPEPEEPEPNPNPDPDPEPEPEPEPEEPEPGATFTVTLDPNGGTINYSTDSVTITVQNGDTYSLPTPTKLLTAFGGWYYGNELIENGDIVALTEDATFTARWSGSGGGGTVINPPIIDPVIPDPDPPDEEYGTGDDEGVSVLSLEETDETAETVSYCKYYTYDLAGNRTGFTLEKGDETVHNINYSYDNLNRLSTVSENGAIEATYTYDTNGNRATLTLGNGVVTTYSYNLANWVTNLSNKNSDGEVLSSYAYTYYASGNQKSKTDNNNVVTSYIYDGLGRLTSESESSGVTLNYTYDSAGNRTKLTATGTESYVIDYTYNSVNQLTSEVKTESGATETTGYTYDANGNMLSKTSPEGTQANTYNNLNQLVFSITAGVTSSYAYNVDGIRTSKTVGTATTDYLLDGGNVVAEAQNGDVTATYLRGANLLSTDNGTSTSYYIFNAHGDVTGLTNGAQAITKTYDYDAFGNEDNPSATDTNPFRYCGEYFDKETGTYYLRARYYDPSIGRFTQQDTHWNTANMIYGDTVNQTDSLGLTNYAYRPNISAIMQSGNLYVYGINNPIFYQDYNGDFAITTAALLAVGKVALTKVVIPFAIGVGQQFLVDVVEYKIKGESGPEELFSSPLEYLGAGLSNIVPGGSSVTTKILSSAASSLIEESFTVLSDPDYNPDEFLLNVGVGTFIDYKVNAKIDTKLASVNTKIDQYVPTKSSYRRKMHADNPEMTGIEIRDSYQKVIISANSIKTSINVGLPLIVRTSISVLLK